MAGLALAVDILAKDRASGTLKKIGDESEKTHKKFAMLGAGLAGGAVGAGLAAFGKKAVEAAVEGEGAHARLAQAVKNTGGSLEDVEPKVAKLTSSFAKFGFSNDEVESGLASMTTSLRDPEKAIGAMGLAADLAKYKNISLSDASVVVAKAMEGQLRPLKQLGIDLPIAAGGALKLENAHTAVAKAQEKVNDVLAKSPDAVNKNSKAHAQYLNAVQGVTAAQDKLADVQNAAGAITKGLAAAVGGQASAAADTYAGKIAAMHAQFENFQEQVGTKLLPVLSKLMNGFETMASFVDRNQAVIKPLAAVLGSLAGTIFLVSKAMKAWAVVQKILDIELAANPIGIVILAIAALAGGLIYAYKHSEKFRAIVQGALHGIADAAKAMWAVIRPVLKAWADAWLLVVGTLITGAAKAFGWVPRIGPKLKAAAKEFDKFKDTVNSSLDGITPTKTITIKAVSAGVAQTDANAGIKSGALSGSEAAASVTTRSGARAARSSSGTTTVVVHHTTVLDGKTVAKSTTTHQTKATQRGALMPGLT